MLASPCKDQLGTSLNGSETFDRFNLIIGDTYKITPELTAYAGYSEANCAPTPLELGCADPASLHYRGLPRLRSAAEADCRIRSRLVSAVAKSFPWVR